MADISIGSTGWASDLVLTPSGDLLTVEGSALGTQRVIRRLFTNAQALIFHPDYGAGLLARIGSTTTARSILAIVRTQIFREAVVVQNPAPQVTVQEIPAGSGEQIISIRYQDRDSGGPMLIAFRPGVPAPTH